MMTSVMTGANGEELGGYVTATGSDGVIKTVGTPNEWRNFLDVEAGKTVRDDVVKRFANMDALYKFLGSNLLTNNADLESLGIHDVTIEKGKDVVDNDFFGGSEHDSVWGQTIAGPLGTGLSFVGGLLYGLTEEGPAQKAFDYAGFKKDYDGHIKEREAAIDRMYPLTKTSNVNQKAIEKLVKDAVTGANSELAKRINAIASYLDGKEDDKEGARKELDDYFARMGDELKNIYAKIEDVKKNPIHYAKDEEASNKFAEGLSKQLDVMAKCLEECKAGAYNHMASSGYSTQNYPMVNGKYVPVEMLTLYGQTVREVMGNMTDILNIVTAENRLKAEGEKNEKIYDKVEALTYSIAGILKGVYNQPNEKELSTSDYGWYAYV